MPSKDQLTEKTFISNEERAKRHGERAKPHRTARRLRPADQEKAEHAKRTALSQDAAQYFVLTAHTVLALGRRIIDCTSDLEKASHYGTLLSGRSHKVYTAVALHSSQGARRHRVAVSCVHLKRTTPPDHLFLTQMLANLSLGNGYDPYTHIGKLIRKCSGTPGTIQGLPLFETSGLLIGQGL